MILLFTDFSHRDPYVGQLHRAIYSVDATLPVIDLFHSVPGFDVRTATYLLPQYCPPENGAVYCCIVDPGVGGNRSPLIIKHDDGYYVGPDNGLFEMLLRRHGCQVSRIDWKPDELSPSFHGRDLFAPVAAKLAKSIPVANSPIEPTRFPDWPDDLNRILYVDHYGNAITGRRADMAEKSQVLKIGGQEIVFAQTFSDVPVGRVFWYENSNGLVEIAVNQGRAADVPGISAGNSFVMQ